MFTKTGEWLDPFNVTHIDAVFKVASASMSKHEQEDFDFNISNGSEISSPNNNRHLNYRIYFWTNQASFDAGTIPWVLPNIVEMNEYHTFNDLDTNYDDLGAEACAEYHCENVVLQ
jgi:hypothetical protein